MLLYVLLQVPALTEFSHDVDVVFGHEDLNCSEDMGVYECSKGVDLIVEEVLFDL